MYDPIVSEMGLDFRASAFVRTLIQPRQRRQPRPLTLHSVAVIVKHAAHAADSFGLPARGRGRDRHARDCAGFVSPFPVDSLAQSRSTIKILP